jgi:hypothetical protein
VNSQSEPDPQPVTLRPNRFLWGGVAILCIGLFLKDFDKGLWPTVAIVIFGTLALGRILPGEASLQLDERGFVLTRWWRRRFVGWDQIADIKVGFRHWSNDNPLTKHVVCIALVKTDRELMQSQLARTDAAFEITLFESFGIGAKKLAEELSWRTQIYRMNHGLHQQRDGLPNQKSEIPDRKSTSPPAPTQENDS